MKRIILALALFICASNVSLTASEVSDVQRELKSAQKELSSLTSKRDKAQRKQTDMQEEYAKALAKVEANQDKPKSLAYKDAVKKSESLSEKLEENAQLLTSLNRQVDSLQGVIRGYESALSQPQQEVAAEKKEEHVEPVEEEAIQLPESLQPVERPVEQKKDKASEPATASKSTGETSSESDGDSSLSPFWTWVLLILGGILFVWIFWVSLKRSLRCPKCGRWFAYEKDGVKVLQKERSRGGHGWEIVYEKRFRCRHCGHKKVEKGRLLTSKSTLPSDWY